MGYTTITGNVATVTIPPNTAAWIITTACGVFQQRVTVKTPSGSPQTFTSNSLFPLPECTGGNINIPSSSSQQTVMLTFEQNPSVWKPSNKLVALETGGDAGLVSIFLAGRDDGGASTLNDFPNSSALLFFYVGYQG